ncbi:MAG: hypothetical protein R2759_18155 [Bacteroidales bacterium]
MKSKRKLFYKVLFILLVLFILGLFLPKYVQRYFYWNFADIYDSEKFPKVEIKNDPNNVSLLAKRPANFEFVVLEKFYDRNENLTFETFIEDHDAVALLVLKRIPLFTKTTLMNLTKHTTFLHSVFQNPLYQRSRELQLMRGIFTVRNNLSLFS